MKFKCTLIVAKNMDKAKQFYHDVLGLGVISDFGANVFLTSGIARQTVDTWKQFIHKQCEIMHSAKIQERIRNPRIRI